MASATIKLTERQKQALKAWEDTQEEFDVLSFDQIAKLSRLPRHQVRRTVREMARKGVTRFVRGCWTDEGYPAGSGYGLTNVGRSVLAQDARP